ncbi:hypothetical protein [Microcystis sp. BLCC-F209]|uniref:hypothetical protein n=1 Tax=Microcystis sp. BLCC-F209 TaxID=3342750 RepID=UPI0035B7D418
MSTDYSLLFDGTDDYVSIPHSSNLSLTRFTIETWVNPSQVKGDWQREHLTYAMSINTYSSQKLENLQLDHKEK